MAFISDYIFHKLVDKFFINRYNKVRIQGDDTMFGYKMSDYDQKIYNEKLVDFLPLYIALYDERTPEVRPPWMPFIKILST